MLELPAGKNPEHIREVLSGCTSFDEVRKKGVLFHGSCEQIEGDLKGGPYDGVFWTARSPAVAQAYIPRAGSRTWISAPQDYERDDHMRPARWSSHATDWALERAGVTIEDLDITWDGQSAHSWTIPEGWPSLGDYEDYIRSLGYEPNVYGNYEVSQSYQGDRTLIMPADWKMPGQLIIAIGSGIEINDPDWSEDAFDYKPHNRVADFARFSERGQHAFHMHDQLQSDFLGNVDHEAIGILPSGLDHLSWMAIPAFRHDGDDPMIYTRPETGEFISLMQELNPDYQPADHEAAEAEFEFS